MNGLIIVDLIKGQLVFEKDYSKNFGFAEAYENGDPDEGNTHSIHSDPMNLASYFYANIKLVDMMAEELLS